MLRPILLQAVESWPQADHWQKRHVKAWAAPQGHDRMFRSTIMAIVDTSDAVGGPAGDYLMRPHLIDLYQAAHQQLNYLDALDGGTCDALLRTLAKADGLDLDNLPQAD